MTARLLPAPRGVPAHTIERKIRRLVAARRPAAVPLVEEAAIWLLCGEQSAADDPAFSPRSTPNLTFHTSMRHERTVATP